MVSERQINKAAIRSLKRSDRVNTYMDRAVELEDRMEESDISPLRAGGRIAHMLGYQVSRIAVMLCMMPQAIADSRTLEIGRMTDLREDESFADFIVRRAEGIDLGNITQEEGQ